MCYLYMGAPYAFNDVVITYQKKKKKRKRKERSDIKGLFEILEEHFKWSIASK
jgi:hypothetical protein